MKDLRERFAKVEIQASEPIVPYRETAVKAPEMAPPKIANSPRGTIHGSSAQSDISFTIRAVPLPDPILSFIQDNLVLVRRVVRERRRVEQVGQTSSGSEPKEEDLEFTEGTNVHGDVLRRPTVRFDEFWTSLEAVCKKCSPEWHFISDKIWAFGPQSAGGCVLIDSRGQQSMKSYVRTSPAFLFS